MTLTETRPELAPQAQLVPPPKPEPSGLAAYLGTGDHKKIGRLFIAFSLVYLVVGVAAGVALSFEGMDQTGLDLFETGNYFQALTLTGQGLVYLALLPLVLGLAILVVPLQVGSRTIAFPRAAAASFWGYLIGGALFVASYGINGGPGGGREEAVDLWLLSFAILVGALLLGALCVVTTVITLRSPGMYLDRVPLFSWSMVVGGVLWILTLPVVLASLLLAYLDHRYGRLGFGGNFDIYPWVHWSLRAPQVFLWAVPALGIVGEVVPVMAGARLRLYRTVLALVAVVGFLGFGAYTVGAYQQLSAETATLPVAGGDWSIYSNWMLVATLVLLPLPILLLAGSWVDTLVRGRNRQLGGPLPLALGAGLLVLLGAAAAALSAIEPLDLFQSQWSAGVAGLALGGSVLAALAGLQYWSVKIWGRRLSPQLGLVIAALGLGGTLLLGAGQMVAGAYDQPDVVLVAANGADAAFAGVIEVPSAAETGNLIATVGWAGLAGAVVLFAFGVLGAAVSSSDDEVPDDPWDGFTLEWATASPPAPGNFEDVALVTSPTPLLDQREAQGGAD